MEDLFSDDTFLARWLSGDLTDKEAAAFEKHPDRAAYERLAKTGSTIRPPEYDAEAELDKLLTRRKELSRPATTTKERSLRPLHYWSAAAAVLLLLVTVWFNWPTASEHYLAGTGELLLAPLSDGSSVRLNAASELEFRNDGNRSATLTGEGFFEVEKSEVPFVVTTNMGTVEVLGTSFNVYARDDKFAVACVTGKVRVTFTGEARTFELTPGKAVSRSSGQAPVPRAHVTEQTTDYLQERSEFNQVPLREVFAEFERQFGFTVRLPVDLDQDEKINTGFNHRDDVDDALKSILFPIPDLQYKIEGKTVTVSRQ